MFDRNEFLKYPKLPITVVYTVPIDGMFWFGGFRQVGHTYPGIQSFK